MISAAKADGHIDRDEQDRIFDKIDEAGLDSEAKAFLMDELRSPLDLDKVVASATCEETAAEIYAASRLPSIRIIRRKRLTCRCSLPGLVWRTASFRRSNTPFAKRRWRDDHQ